MTQARQFIGNTFFVIGQIISILLFLPAVLIVTPFLSSTKKADFVSYWARFIIWWLKICCGITYRVTGAENIPSTPTIIAANHQSAWETIALQRIFPAQSYILKRELLWIPFFGWGLAANEPIAIDRSKTKQAMKLLIKQGKQRISDGRSVVIFPEGTRQAVGQFGRFKAGGAVMACALDAAIVPVAHNAGVFWSKAKPFSKKPGVIEVVIGEAIQPADLTPTQLTEQVQQWITTTGAKLPTRA